MIVKQGKGYGVRVSIEGKRVWLGTFKKRCAECYKAPKACRRCDLQALTEAEEAQERALAQAAGVYQTSVREFSERWLDDYPRPRSTTNDAYEREIRPFVAQFGGRELETLTRTEARAWALSNRHRVKAVKAMLSDARNEGLCKDNPFSDMRLPQPKGRRDLVPLTEQEVTALADEARQFDGELALTMRAAVLTLGYTGMRPSELFALEWSDLDLRTGEVSISKRRYRQTTDLPKTGRSRRIVLHRPAAQAIQAVPRHIGFDSYVFRSPRGHAFTLGSFSRYFNLMRSGFQAKLSETRRAQLGTIVPYVLRHACASMLLDKGATPEDVATQLGHVNSRLVTSLYGHPREDLTRDRLRAAFDQRVPELRVVKDEEAANG